MNCTICKNGELEPGTVTVTLQRGESIVVIKNVPASVCQNCGEYVLSEEVSRKVMGLSEKAVENHVEIEVLQYAA